VLALIERIGLGTTRALSAIGLIALLILAGLTLADGLMRWLANQPIEGVRDVGALAIAVAVACCLPIGLAERSNITIRLAESSLGARIGRPVGQALDVFAAMVVAIVMAVMSWQFFVYAGKIAHANETTWVLKIPRAPFWYAVTAILAIAVLVQLIVVALEIARFRTRSAR
jgi:TRAP-type transport system small permease protein